MRILQTVVSGIPLVSGHGTRRYDPHVSVVFGASSLQCSTLQQSLASVIQGPQHEEQAPAMFASTRRFVRYTRSPATCVKACIRAAQSATPPEPQPEKRQNKNVPSLPRLAEAEPTIDENTKKRRLSTPSI